VEVTEDIARTGFAVVDDHIAEDILDAGMFEAIRVR